MRTKFPEAPRPFWDFLTCNFQRVLTLFLTMISHSFLRQEAQRKGTKRQRTHRSGTQRQGAQRQGTQRPPTGSTATRGTNYNPTCTTVPDGRKTPPPPPPSSNATCTTVPDGRSMHYTPPPHNPRQRQIQTLLRATDSTKLTLKIVLGACAHSLPTWYPFWAPF